MCSPVSGAALGLLGDGLIDVGPDQGCALAQAKRGAPFALLAGLPFACIGWGLLGGLGIGLCQDSRTVTLQFQVAWGVVTGRAWHHIVRRQRDIT